MRLGLLICEVYYDVYFVTDGNRTLNNDSANSSGVTSGTAPGDTIQGVTPE